MFSTTFNTRVADCRPGFAQRQQAQHQPEELERRLRERIGLRQYRRARLHRKILPGVMGALSSHADVHNLAVGRRQVVAQGRELVLLELMTICTLSVSRPGRGILICAASMSRVIHSGANHRRSPPAL